MEKLYRFNGIALLSQCVPFQAILSILIFILLTTTGQAQVNSYAKVTAIGVSSGKSVLSISNVNQAFHTFNPGEQVLVIQMQDNVISGTSNNSSFGLLTAIGKAGQYEEATISTIAPSMAAPTSITLTKTLTNTFTIGSNSSVQVVSFAKQLTSPSLTDFTTTTNITAVPWNGSLGTGGVVAFQVPGVLTLKNSISADGQGFAGGPKSANYGTSNCEPTVYITSSTNYGGKGEGIYLINTTSNPTYVRGRARVVTGGGGGSALRAGGAGGSNYSAGGAGGSGGLYFVNDCTGSGNVSGGLGGVALSTYSALGTRIFMGGGGGGGNGNSGQTAGGNGGGIIIIKAGTLTTSCSSSSITISANGNDAGDSGDDGAGGAGAAGTILLQVGTYSVPGSCRLNIQANGGDGGGSNGWFNIASGGGGGGQGAVLFSGTSLPTTNITTTTTPGSGGQNGAFSGTSASNASGSNTSGVIVGIGMVLPVQLVYFAVENKNNNAVLNWTSEDESNVTYRVQRSTDGINFITIGTVTGTGAGNYSFTDPNPESGRNYYRLEIAGNISSKTSLSSIVTFNVSDLVKVLTAYPNPAHDHFYIRVSGNNNKTHVVTITDLTGQLVYTTSSKPANIIITVTPNRPLKPGLYMFKVTTDGSEQSGKVMIQ